MLKRVPVRLFRGFSSKVPKEPSGLPKIRDTNTNEVRPKAYAPAYKKDIELPSSSSTTPYIPKEKHERVTFEIPDESSSKNETKSSKIRWRSVIPIGVIAIGGAWALYTFNYFTDDTPTEFLSPNKFIPFIITNKVDIDKDHYLIELTPKFNKWQRDSKDNQIWNGNKLWSVEVKQPQIMVVRRYTPLPLEIYNSEETGEPIIRVQDYEEEGMSDGKLVFYIKKYDQGEVARWIYRKPIGSELELRGPYTEFEFSKTVNHKLERPQFKNLPSSIRADPEFTLKPDNLAFFAAGTGIAPVFQTLLSRNPYRGFIDVYYSRKTESETPFKNLMYFLEKLDRAKFHHFVQETNGSLKLKDVPKPVVSASKSKEQQDAVAREEHEKLVQLKLKELKKGEVSSSSSSSTTSTSQPANTSTSVDNKPENSPRFKTALDQASHTKSQPKSGPALALVCGPDGYVSYVAGAKPYDAQGPVGGLLKEKGWSSEEENVFKM